MPLRTTQWQVTVEDKATHLSDVRSVLETLTECSYPKQMNASLLVSHRPSLASVADGRKGEDKRASYEDNVGSNGVDGIL